MQPFCFGRENKEKRKHGIVGYIAIWGDNSKHIWVRNSQYNMQNCYFEYHKTTISYCFCYTPATGAYCSFSPTMGQITCVWREKTWGWLEMFRGSFSEG